MGLYKRGNQWWGRHDGKRFPLEIEVGVDVKATRKLAGDIFAKRVLELSEEAHFPERKDQRKTLADLLNRWMADHGDTLKSAPELRCYRATLLKHLGAGTKLPQITSDRIEKYKQTRLESVGVAAINRELAMLRAAFTFAIKKWKWFSRNNPVWEAGLCTGESHRERWLLVEECDRLKAVSPKWFWDICEFVIATGLRREEVCRMVWADIDLKARTLTIPVSKNGKPAIIPLLDSALTVLSRQVRSLVTKAVFPYQPDYLTRHMGRYTKEASIDDFRFHDLRHTAATYLVRDGVDLYTVQKLMRHSSIDQTSRYAHHDCESVRVNIEKAQKTAQVAG